MGLDSGLLKGFGRGGREMGRGACWRVLRDEQVMRWIDRKDGYLFYV